MATQVFKKNEEEQKGESSGCFLDETWANAHDGKDRTWVELDQATDGMKGGVRMPSGIHALQSYSLFSLPSITARRNAYFRTRNGERNSVE